MSNSKEKELIELELAEELNSLSESEKREALELILKINKLDKDSIKEILPIVENKFLELTKKEELY
ncbi:hypothetical protein [Clostridioides difficile]|uniref:hypothetical protein n=1 Tax=Clostridioides difficile TaxID=1496 RepID=UPI000D1E7AA9|nr:hypothetical protein [Clostridioides difficile]HBE9444676.1 hypothetical protein [Clostridioides difficile]